MHSGGCGSRHVLPHEVTCLCLCRFVHNEINNSRQFCVFHHFGV